MAQIEVRHLTKTFTSRDARVDALKDINLEIEQGDIYGIIGMSGAGKSTLVRCLNYLEQPTEGEVLVEGRELGKMSEKELLKQRKDMAMIFQHFNLLMQKNVVDNVSFPLLIQGIKKKDARKRAKELLGIVGLEEKASAYPAQLSGGQKQRVAIARALATEPKVLLCDEATSALDPNTTAGVLSLLKDINERLGITIVVITHEMSVIQKICSRVAILDGGDIAEIGSVEEIFRSPKTQIGRELVFHDGEKKEAYVGHVPYCYRTVFKGDSANEPILGNMMIEYGAPVNILSGNTRNIKGGVFGQMILQFPEDAEVRGKMIQYLRDRKVEVEEVEYV